MWSYESRREKSDGDSTFSVSDAIQEETEKLLEVVKQEGKFGKRQQESLKALVRIYSPRSHLSVGNTVS